VGGGPRSAWWAQRLANTFGLTLTAHQDSESGGAMGAARVAWLAAGGDLDTVCVTPPVRQRFELDAARGDALRARHARFGGLYLALS
jgi:xylulokinase